MFKPPDLKSEHEILGTLIGGVGKTASYPTLIQIQEWNY